MATVIYKSLTALQPVELNYSYHRNETLQTEQISYSDGFTFYNIDGLKNFKDTTINKNSCFILTSAVSLSTLFTEPELLSLGKIPCTINFQPRVTTINYAFYNAQNNAITLSPVSATNFFIYPVDNDQVEIRVDSKYLQIDIDYPYQVRLGNIEDESVNITRRRFYPVFQDNLLSLKVLTDSGFRYLAFNNDNILRATGCILNESILNDYIFKVTNITTTTHEKNFVPSNDWVTYFQDFESQTNNKTVAINKNFKNIPTHLLIDFPIEQAINTGEATINIANLKTSYTPTGGPAPVDNSYEEQIVTTN